MKVFIGCSHKSSTLNVYKELASSVATIMARRRYKLVYGGGSQGMMGSCYMTYKYEGEKVKGFYDVTEAKQADELELDAVDVTPTTFERTKHLYMHADFIIILPGGIGTMAELLSMIMEKQTKQDDKKIVLFNYNKFYDNFLYQLKDMMDEGFINEETLQQFDIVTSIQDFEGYVDKMMKEVD